MTATARHARGRTTPALVTALYAAVVIVGAAHHEPWRDEVVPLSIARAARSFGELIAPLHFEGHPVLWYAALWLGWRLVHATWVLKALSLGAAIGTVFLVNRSALPWWLRWTFTASFYPLYQYSVVSRGYGLEMFLLFAFVALHACPRPRPLALACVLAALANTEVFGLVMAVAAAAMLVVEGVLRHDERPPASRATLALAAAVFLGGVALSASVAAPAAAHPLAGFRRYGWSSIAAGVAMAILRPAAHFSALSALPAPSLLVWAYWVYLLPRPALLAFVALALVGMEAFFSIVYGPNALWHLGNPLLVVVASACLAADAPGAARPVPVRFAAAHVWLGRALALALLVTLAAEIPRGVRALALDYAHDYSANRRLAELLARDPTLANAVVMGEPDMLVWSLPYYAENRLYLPREATYRAWGTFAPPRVRSYDLDALLAAARRVHGECRCPVVTTLGVALDPPATHTRFAGTPFEETFTITDASRDAFLAAMQPLGRTAPTITDETYHIYLLR